MIKFIFFILISINIFAETIGIAAGSKTGTYYKFANDIKEVCNSDFNVNVHEGGSIVNIERVLKDRNVQFAIVQYDALLYYKHSKKENLENFIKMIFPLYKEEIHVIVRKNSNIYDLTDLEGKKVSVDKENSGSFVTANVIKNKTGISWNEYHYDSKEAMKKIISGEIDAMIYVAGAPVGILSLFDKKSETAKKYFKLLSVRHKELDKIYETKTIDKSTYKWMDSDVDTYAVNAVLITYNYTKQDLESHRFNYYYANIYKLINKIVENIDYLKSYAHPKWKEVEPLELAKINWQVHEQAVKAVKNLKNLSSEEEDLLNLLDEKVSSEAQSLINLLN